MRAKRIWLNAGALVLAAVGGLWLALDRHVEGSATTAPSDPPGGARPLRTSVSALGRVQPKGGVVRVAGPSRASVVVSRVLVAEGDHVEAGATLAVLDDYPVHEANVQRLHADLEQAQPERKPWKGYLRGRLAPPPASAGKPVKPGDVDLRAVFAELDGARAELARSTVRSPVSGTVLKVHAQAGERVGPEGVVELGQTDEMHVMAEVYETDVPRVRVGQRAVVTSATLDGTLEGTVERIGRMVGKRDVVGIDPVDQIDARVVEVDVRLDDGKKVAALTNLQVEVAIRP